MVGHLIMNTAYRCLGNVPFLRGSLVICLGLWSQAVPCAVVNKPGEVISLFIISMCREADKIPECLDTQISIGWWESWDPQSRHFKPVPKSCLNGFKVCSLSVCVLAWSVHSLCLLTLQVHLCSSSYRGWGMPQPPCSTIVIKEQEKKMEHLTSHWAQWEKWPARFPDIYHW